MIFELGRATATLEAIIRGTESRVVLPQQNTAGFIAHGKFLSTRAKRELDAALAVEHDPPWVKRRFKSKPKNRKGR